MFDGSFPQGFDGLFFGRLDHEDKSQRMKEKSMEMIWSASNTQGKLKIKTIKKRYKF